MSDGPTLRIPEETMRGLIGHAILAAIDEDARTALLQSAINYLVAPSKHRDSWRNETGPSPLENAFKIALENYARDYVKEWMDTDDEFRASIRQQLDTLFGAYKERMGDHAFQRELNVWVLEYFVNKGRREY